MAVHKAVKTGKTNPFYIEDRPLVDVFQDREGSYWVSTEVARSYDYLVRYFREKEPEHPLLEKVEDGDRTYYTIDLADGDQRQALTRMTESGASWRFSPEEFSRISQRRPLQRTRLLDYLVDRYGVGYSIELYYLTSRRMREYETIDVPEPLEPLVEALGINTSDIRRAGRREQNYWQGRIPRLRAHSVRIHREVLSLRGLVRGLFKGSYTHEYDRIEKPLFSYEAEERVRLYRPYRSHMSLGVLLEQWENIWESGRNILSSASVNPDIEKVLEARLSMSDRLNLASYQSMPAFIMSTGREKSITTYQSGVFSSYYGELEDYAFMAWLKQEYNISYSYENLRYLVPRKENFLRRPNLPQIHLKEETGDLRQLSLL